jgi:mannose-6-phosphate isomerase-like protein (cupin superfamily)
MTPAEAKFLLDPYLNWTKREGIPVHEGVTVDLLAAKTGPWPRLGDGCKGAFVHLDGRGDWLTMFLLDLPPGSRSAPQRHLYDEVFYVLSGTGSMSIETPNGVRTFEFAPGDVLTPPLNAPYRLSNNSGREPTRLGCANDLRILLNIFHDEAFFFDNPFVFPERGENPAVTEKTSIEARIVGIPAGTHRAPGDDDAGFHMLGIDGTGFSLLWQRGNCDFQRIDWRPGLCFALPEAMIHQHFNAGTQPARYFAVGFGTRRHPIVQARRRSGTEGHKGVEPAHTERDTRIRALWLEELRKTSIGSEMTHGLPVRSRLA